MYDLFITAAGPWAQRDTTEEESEKHSVVIVFNTFAIAFHALTIAMVLVGYT